ncbi:hypothetical protein [Paraburkholderia tropica]|uniref:hypothetical protein n=1 Tax=Paraburkholderia tropica TaxID=92647 RepID=UPI001F23C108|nr:hypothetical protein [Paraburkholderia tropica]
MSWDDHLNNSELENLPPEAHGNPFDVEGPFEPDEDWLASAPRDDQIIAIRGWFTDRYCDPASNTPYNGREGGYQFIDGGPYSPDEELGRRFSGIVPFNVIEEVVEELEAEVGENWARIRREPDYDDWMEDLPDVPGPDAPMARLRERLQQGMAVLTLRGAPGAQELAIQLVYVQALGALEAFLYETALYWIEEDDQLVKQCITCLPVFADEKIPLKAIFDEHDKLKSRVKEYLYHLVWHRWKDVCPLYERGLGVRLPSVKDFQDVLGKRHDIVHRCGADRDGRTVSIEDTEVRLLSEKIEEFCRNVSNSFDRGF